MGNLPVTSERFLANKNQHSESNRVNSVERFPVKPEELNENETKRAIQSMDLLMGQMLSKRLSKMAERKDSSDYPFDAHSISATFANLAHMLNTRTEDYLALAKQNGIVTAPAYKSLDNNNNVCESSLNKANYKNLFSKLDNLDAIVSELSESSSDESNLKHSLQTCNPTPSALFTNHKENQVSTGDSIKINLPEILDQNDEITILRLLIKLLSDKVRKLTDDKQRLLVQISTLNEINNEMVSIIEYNFKK